MGQTLRAKIPMAHTLNGANAQWINPSIHQTRSCPSIDQPQQSTAQPNTQSNMHWNTQPTKPQSMNGPPRSAYLPISPIPR
eukprot:1230699-Lingulodinium_polyedra.AAC.1